MTYWLLVATVFVSPLAIAGLMLLLGSRYRVVWSTWGDDGRVEILCTTYTRRQALRIRDHLLRQRGQQYRVYDRRLQRFVD